MALADECPSQAQPLTPPAATLGSGEKGQGAELEPADSLAQVLRQETLQDRLEIAREWGFEPQQLLLIRAYKARMQRLHWEMTEALQQLAVVMYTPADDPGQRQAAARAAVERCRQLAEQDRQLQEELIERLGARDDPVKMAALMLLGAVGQRRTVCEIRPGVAGGAQGAPALLQGPNLRHSLSEPFGLRARRWLGYAQVVPQPGAADNE
jgi:hypothetical protein